MHVPRMLEELGGAPEHALAAARLQLLCKLCHLDGGEGVQELGQAQLLHVICCRRNDAPSISAGGHRHALALAPKQPPAVR